MEISQMVVADKYQLDTRDGETYKVNGPKHKVAEKQVVERSFVEKVNETSEIGGKLFVIDEKATEEFKINRDKKIESNNAKKAELKNGVNDLAKSLVKVASEANNPESGNNNAKKAELLEEYKTLFGKAPSKNMTASTIEAKITAKRVEKHTKDANSFFENEDWQDAIDNYALVLELEPDNKHAKSRTQEAKSKIQ